MENLNLILSIAASILSIVSIGWNISLRKEINSFKGDKNISSRGDNSINNTGDNSHINR
ncbi:hypothetical protein [Planococcus maritimus]|uniref:hypothetical protein n=1 Tax=Planococcus maritimus TaxID=192421 RepID=UPI00164224E9|nr:hypothetical protein [Planococcus maritimus]